MRKLLVENLEMNHARTTVGEVSCFQQLYEYMGAASTVEPMAGGEKYYKISKYWRLVESFWDTVNSVIDYGFYGCTGPLTRSAGSITSTASPSAISWLSITKPPSIKHRISSSSRNHSPLSPLS